VGATILGSAPGACARRVCVNARMNARTVARILSVCVLLALAAPAAGEAAASSASLRTRFDSAVSKLVKADFKAFCGYFTESGLRRLGGKSRCASGLRDQNPGRRLQRAASGLSVRFVKVKGKKGQVGWRAAGRNDLARWRYERGAWRLSIFFGG
jgi:hypothetical protein